MWRRRWRWWRGWWRRRKDCSPKERSARTLWRIGYQAALRFAPLTPLSLDFEQNVMYKQLRSKLQLNTIPVQLQQGSATIATEETGFEMSTSYYWARVGVSRRRTAWVGTPGGGEKVMPLCHSLLTIHCCCCNLIQRALPCHHRTTAAHICHRTILHCSYMPPLLGKKLTVIHIFTSSQAFLIEIFFAAVVIAI